MKTIIRFSLFIITSLLISACTSEEKHPADTRTVFKYNDLAGISSLDPAAAKTFENIWAVNQLYNGLVEMSDSLVVKPSIASSWEIINNGKTYLFHLRNDVFFHDHKFFSEGKGRKVIASDFVYSFNRLLDAKVSSATSLLSNINTKNKPGFEAINDSTFAIHLEKPFTPFLGILTMKYFSVIPKEVVDRTGEDFRRNPVGTGPFQFKMWEEGSRLVFVKNENTRFMGLFDDARLFTTYLSAVVNPSGAVVSFCVTTPSALLQ